MPEGPMEHFLRSSHFSGGNAAYIEDLYDVYLHDRNGVPEEWSSFFDTLPRSGTNAAPDVSHATIVQHFELLGRRQARPTPASQSGSADQLLPVSRSSESQLRSHRLDGAQGCSRPPPPFSRINGR